MYAQNPSALEKHTNVITSTINKISEAIQDLKKNYCIAKISVQSPVINPEIMSSKKLSPKLGVSSFKFERRNITNSESSLVVGQFLHSHLSKQTLLLIMKIQIVCPVGMMRGSGRFVLMQPLAFKMQESQYQQNQEIGQWT